MRGIDAIGMHRAVHQLRYLGIHDIIMLTGDKRTVAREMAHRLRFNWYHAETLPEDKAKYVKQYRRNSTVMMVGDGAEPNGLKARNQHTKHKTV